MSVINRVLSDLEKRGVNALPGEPSVRVVPAQKNWLKPALLAAAIAVLVLVATMQWRSSAQPKHAAPVAAGMLHGSQAGSASAVSATSASAISAPALPVAQLQAASHPVAVVSTQEIRRQDRQPDTAQKNGGGEAAVPAMRMSFELSSIPLPSSLRAQLPAAAHGQHSAFGKPASPAKPAVAAGVELAQPVAAPSPLQRNASLAAESKTPPAAVPASSVDKKISVQQQADNEFRKASGLIQQGRISEALAGYEAALRLDAGHDAARQAMVGLLLENKRNADAEIALQDGLAHNPRHSGFAMLLARMQVERDALPLALDTLLKTLPYADRQADFQAFVAALLQRQNRHQEAIAHYQIALQLSPDSGVWLMGLGISLQALQRNEEARNAFRRALESRAMNIELQAFIRQRLKEL